MAWSGDYTGMLDELLREVPFDELITNLKFRNYWYGLISSDVSALKMDGKYRTWLLHKSTNFNARPRSEYGDVVKPGRDDFDTAKIDTKEIMNSIGWTKEELERINGDAGSLAHLVRFKTKNSPIAMRRRLNHAFAGDGTGRLARVASYSETTADVEGVVTIDSDAADFGIECFDYLQNGDRVDIYTVADITGTSAWTTKCINCEVLSVNATAKTFTVKILTDTSSTAVDSSAISAAPADGDYVFMHNSVTLTSDNKWSAWNQPLGMMAIVDDGANAGHEFTESGNLYNGNWYGATYATLTRASYPQLLATVRRAGDWASGGTDGTAATCDWATIEDEIGDFEDALTGGGIVNAILMNRKTNSWLKRTSYSDENFQRVTSGTMVPGLTMEAVMIAGNRRRIMINNQIPDGTMYYGDLSDLRRLPEVDLGWHAYMGKIAFESPGTRNLTYESWMRWKGNLFALRCDQWCRLEDIDISS